MSKKLTRSKIRKAVRLSVAINVRDLAGGFTHDMVGLSQEEYTIFSEECERLYTILAGTYPTQFGSVDECLEYFRNH